MCDCMSGGESGGLMGGGCADVGLLLRRAVSSQCSGGEEEDDGENTTFDRQIRRHSGSDYYYAPGVFLVDSTEIIPTESELECFQITAKFLDRAQFCLQDLASYGAGATEAIRKAITVGGGAREVAWNSLVGLVGRLKSYYQLSLMLQEVLCEQLWQLCNGPVPPSRQLTTQRACTLQLAKLFDFLLRFDRLKMATPAVQNDFSYYRRTCSRQALLCGGVPSDSPEKEERRLLKDEVEEENEDDRLGRRSPKKSKKSDTVVVDCETANAMCFFFAEPAPMLAAARQSAIRFVQQNSDLPSENVTDMLTALIAICRNTAERCDSKYKTGGERSSPMQSADRCQDERYSDESSALLQELCLSAMVGAVVLYDHVHPSGAFVRPSPINIRAVVRCVRAAANDGGGDAALATTRGQRLLRLSEDLMNTLRYTTKHAADATTPKSLRNLLAF